MMIVVMAHVVAPAGARTGATLSPYLNRLAVGLTLFFLISAFLLYRPFVRARIDGKRRPGVSSYAWGRVLRIVPGYWVALIVTSLWLGTAGVFTLTGAPRFFGFAQIYSNNTALGGIAVAWSLCVEVTFYVFLPIFAAAMWRVPGRTRDSRVAGELLAIGGLILFSIGYKVLVSETGLHHHYAALLALPAYLDWLATGMALAVLSVWIEGRDSSPAAFRLVDRWPVLCWAGALVAFWVVSTQIGLDGGFPRPDEIGYLAEHMLYLLVGFLLFLPAVFGDPGRGAVRKLLANPVLAYLGTISYGIFLYHLAVIEQLKDWDLNSIGFIHPYILWPTVTLILASAIATVSWYAIERPALSLKRRLSGRREPQPPERAAEPSAAGAAP
jgi:peptidoglycan/LPS O-acetylase OafA/YrhL